MAVYEKLLLSAGGGIVSVQQQAEQEPNAANLLIGLGGTGVDCLRTIKTQVYSRLKPDDPQAIIPEYEHIRFLGVDTDQKSRGSQTEDEEARADSLLALDDTEYFSISSAHVKSDLQNRIALDDREDLKWMRYEDITPGDLNIAGAGGIRQVGRYMLMNKSSLFLSRIEQEINAAKSGLSNPTVYIHIFSGLSGGTGSGTFLDVCYMVRSIAKKVGGVTIFGYFFLPDVNLSRIPAANTKVRDFVPRNGYAAMQELDYCMQLQSNGGVFTQAYQGKKIEWRDAPVDLCHLVCATDTNNNVVPNAYEYAMNVTAEYVMDFLTKSDGFTLESQFSNFRSCVGMANAQKRYGTNVSYCVIGAACASLPLREVNTYLASELFAKFARVGAAAPAQSDVEAFAMASLGRSGKASINQLYDRLTTEMQEGFDFTFEDFPDDYRAVLNGGNQALIDHYSSQAAAKRGVAQKNAKSMQAKDNEGSLIGRMRGALEDVIRDINRGPMFAHGMLSAAVSHSMLNVVDGLIEQNKANWDQQAFNSDRIYKAYQEAQRIFLQRVKRSMFDNDRKRYEDYKASIVYVEQDQLACRCYAMMDKTLRMLRDQIKEEDARFYARLARVTATLIDTFKENRDALAAQRQATVVDAFAMPLMTIDELKGSMDREVEGVNVPGRFDELMGAFLSDDGEWLQEDEGKIARIVTRFFVEVAFGEFASRSITAFLKDKYDTDNDEDLTNRVYNDWIVKLTEKARPLFYFNGTVWTEAQTSQLAFLSVPATSEPVQKAAKKMEKINDLYKVKVSSLTDRIFVMSSAAALPLSAYNNCEEYEQAYYSVTASPGVHYYEGKPIPGMLFDDWRKLAPLTPQSLVRMDRVPHQVRENVLAARALFDRAEAEGLLSAERKILRPTARSLEALRAAAAACDQVAAQLQRPDQVGDAEGALERLASAGALELEETGRGCPDDGPTDPDVRRRMFVDYFVSAPAHQVLVRQIMDEVDEARELAAASERALRERMESVGAGNRDMADYCDALFTGVISLEGFTVVYHRTEHGIVTDITLSKRGGEFPFGFIPVYQGFVSYQALGAADKEQIRAEVERLYNAYDPKIMATGAKLKELLVDDRINAWAMRAADLPSRAEVVEFLGGLRDKFRLFCMENMI